MPRLGSVLLSAARVMESSCQVTSQQGEVAVIKFQLSAQFQVRVRCEKTVCKI
jgi:hypothetical protein